MNFNSYFTIKHTSNLRILLLTLFFIVPLGTIYGQNQLITIAGKNITLLKAFDAIESQTQLSITYSRTKIDVNRTLSVDFKKQKLSIVLDKLLAGTGFTYKIEKGYIVLVPVPVKQEQTEATSKKIQGVIVDTNGDPVIGASIQEKGVAGTMFKVVNKPMDKAIDRNSVSVFSADIDLLNRKFPFRQDFANGSVGQFV